MPGTAEDPVRIGPFKRLKEVHWNTIKYIAIRCIHRALYSGVETGSSGSVPAFDPDTDIPIPAVDWEQTFIVWSGSDGAPTERISESSYDIQQFEGTRYFFDAYGMRSTEGADWGGLDAEEVEVEGIPSAVFTFIATITSGEGHPLDNPVFPADGLFSGGAWDYTAGGVPDVKIPGTFGVTPGTYFDEAPSADFVIGNNAVWDESFYWGNQTPGPLIGYGAYTSASPTELYRKAWDSAGIVATFRGKAFRGVAMHHPDGDVANGLWVLLERSPADDGTA